MPNRNLSDIVNSKLYPDYNVFSVAVNSDDVLETWKKYPIDTSKKQITLTLPSTPDEFARIEVFDYSGNAYTNPFTIDAGSKKINDVASKYVIDNNHGGIGLIYIDGNWHTYSDQFSYFDSGKIVATPIRENDKFHFDHIYEYGGMIFSAKINGIFKKGMLTDSDKFQEIYLGNHFIELDVNNSLFKRHGMYTLNDRLYIAKADGEYPLDHLSKLVEVVR